MRTARCRGSGLCRTGRKRPDLWARTLDRTRGMVWTPICPSPSEMIETTRRSGRRRPPRRCWPRVEPRRRDRRRAARLPAGPRGDRSALRVCAQDGGGLKWLKDSTNRATEVAHQGQGQGRKSAPVAAVRRGRPTEEGQDPDARRSVAQGPGLRQEELSVERPRDHAARAPQGRLRLRRSRGARARGQARAAVKLETRQNTVPLHLPARVTSSKGSTRCPRSSWLSLLEVALMSTRSEAAAAPAHQFARSRSSPRPNTDEVAPAELDGGARVVATRSTVHGARSEHSLLFPGCRKKISRPLISKSRSTNASRTTSITSTVRRHARHDGKSAGAPSVVAALPVAVDRDHRG